MADGVPARPTQRWNGYRRTDFEVDGRACILVCPESPATGTPWIWRTEFFGHEPQADVALLGLGFHVAYIDVQDMYGAPVAMRHMDALYAHLTTRHGLSPRAVLEGFSRGGLFAFNWAALHPERVACIYADAPVCDFKSWPGGKGVGPGSPADWRKCLDAYALTEAEALAYPRNPVDNLQPLAAAGIPLLHVCGAADEGVPFDENTRVVEGRYPALGASIVVLAKPFCRHHPHSLRDPAPIVRFVLRHTGLGDAPVHAPGTPYGYDYFTLRDGLSNCRQRFASERRGRVVFLGGSITAGAGWRDLVAQDLRRHFPETEFELVNAGIPSLGSVPGAFRFARDVLARGRVDLLFAEAAVNDQTNGQSDPEQVRGMEGIVRHARNADPMMDIVLLHFVDHAKMAVIRGGGTPAVICNHERVAERYGVPSLDLAQEVTERIHAGEFTWEEDFRDLHPSPFGHALYARAIGRLLDAAWSGGPPADAAAARPHGLPAPLDTACYDRGRLVGVAAAHLGDGWTLVPRWVPVDGVAARPGFTDVPAAVAEHPGPVLRLAFAGTAVGVFVASGPDAGAIEFRVDGGAMETRDLFTPWSRSLHLPWAQVLAAGLPPGHHDLEMRVAEGAHPESRGHAVRIVHFLINGVE